SRQHSSSRRSRGWRVFCTRLSWVAPDAVVQCAMRHSRSETMRHVQLGMVQQVRQNLEKANGCTGRAEYYVFMKVSPLAKPSRKWPSVSKGYRRSKWRARPDSNGRPAA